MLGGGSEGWAMDDSRGRVRRRFHLVKADGPVRGATRISTIDRGKKGEIFPLYST